MVKRFLCASLTLLWLTPFLGPNGTSLAQETNEPFRGYLEAVIEPLAEPPYEQEMVLLTIRGYYPGNIAQQTLEQPILMNVGWMQLGSDSWEETTFQDHQVTGFERVMAIFPQRSGLIEIPPFVHRLTFQTRSGRTTMEMSTQPISIEVRPKPAGDGW
jgi:hypothetical protein